MALARDERGRLRDRPEEGRGTVGDTGERVLGVEEAGTHIPQGRQRVDARCAVADGRAQQVGRVGRAVHEEVLLAREVVEDRHARDAGLARDLGDGDGFVPALEEQPVRDLQDACARLRAAALAGSGHPSRSLLCD
jgi:hypothetical protein